MNAEQIVTTRQCALCGSEISDDGFCIEERWTTDEVESRSVTAFALERAQRDDGTVTFYFCRWRHLGDFLSDSQIE